MNTKSCKIWMAYLDDELDAVEISDFEDQSSPEDIQRLEKEKHLETEISISLSEAKCPEDVWNNVISDIKYLESKKSSRMKFAAVAGIAALICLSSLIFYNIVIKQDFPVLKQVTTLDDLNKEVEIPGDSPSRIQSLLKSYSFDLLLAPIPKDGHKIRLLGAYVSSCSCNEKVVALCFDCCGKPVRLVVMQDGTDFVKYCERGCKEGKIQKLVKKGSYRVAVIGKHSGDELLKLLQVPVLNKNVNNYEYVGLIVSK